MFIWDTSLYDLDYIATKNENESLQHLEPSTSRGAHLSAVLFQECYIKSRCYTIFRHRM